MLNIKITNRKSERECDLNFRTILAANQERGCEKTPTNRKRVLRRPIGKLDPWLRENREESSKII